MFIPFRNQGHFCSASRNMRVRTFFFSASIASPREIYARRRPPSICVKTSSLQHRRNDDCYRRRTRPDAGLTRTISNTSFADKQRLVNGRQNFSYLNGICNSCNTREPIAVGVRTFYIYDFFAAPFGHYSDPDTYNSRSATVAGGS